MLYLFIHPFDPPSLYICLCQALCSVLGIQWGTEDVLPVLKGHHIVGKTGSYQIREKTLISAMKKKYQVL